MRKLRVTTVLGLLLLFGVAGCLDEVTNPNDPGTERALGSAEDVESLIAGSYHSWWETVGHPADAGGPQFFLSTASFQHSAWPANFGAVFYSAFPRTPVVNDPANEYYFFFSGYWNSLYSALSAVQQGLQAIDEGEGVAEGLGPQRVQRARAYGKFVQGLAHGSAALLFDQAIIVDETVETVDEAGDPLFDLETVPYDQLMESAIGYFDEAIQLADGAEFDDIPASWMSTAVSPDRLAQLASSFKARYRAAAARSPAEREAVNWQAVLDEVDAGVEEPFEMELTGMYDYSGWTSDALGYWSLAAWQQVNYYILGMADQSGDYQAWLSQPIAQRLPEVDDDPVLIVTPDERFAQGSTMEEQIANPGTLYRIPSADAYEDGLGNFSVVNSHQQSARGTWRWSYYFTTEAEANFGAVPWPEITTEEMDLLAAEAHLRLGQAGDAAALVNLTREAAGLNATDASGTNTDCVPRLPDETCGDLMEMLKWEKRIETQFKGLHSVPWYFEGRGWGDLYVGTPLHFPVPSRDLQIIDQSVYTLGGEGNEGGAPPSVYDFPFEN